MVISERGLDLIRQFESLRLNAYRCPAGVLTIGYGSTRGVTKGMTITKAEAERRLREDLVPVQAAITKLVNVDLTQGQFDALCSFVFNVGEGAFKKSTLLKILNQGRYDAACRELDKWTKGGGKVLAGLVRRRDAEQSLWKTFDLDDEDTGTLSNHEISPVEPKSVMSSRTVAGGGVALLAGSGAVGQKAMEIADRHSDRLIDTLFSSQSVGLWCGVIAALAIGYMVWRYINDRHERV